MAEEAVAEGGTGGRVAGALCRIFGRALAVAVGAVLPRGPASIALLDALIGRGGMPALRSAAADPYDG